MQQVTIQYFPTPYGELILGSFNSQLCLCDWRYRKQRDGIDRRITAQLAAGYIEGDDDVLRETRHQLTQYFHSERKTFDLPLLLVGTDFQQQVWQALLKIPFSETATYLSLSELIGNKKAVRAVANANGANALSIIVPCHRIIGSDGQLVGYAGGVETKKKLLKLEQDMFAFDAV
jgi:methylated-DNA-[protein]-cysteine S-methyltransferase